ncbi:MAG: tetratricopeptide repeat protein [Acidobacteria bacterium]|nr:tetratricopeptide repeat protein [Acidobacteriota bacterium]
MSIIEQIKRQEKLFIWLPILLVIVCFSNTLTYQFVYDDLFQVIEAAPVLGDWSKENLVRLFDRDFWGFVNQHLATEGKLRSQYYRPIQSFFSMVVYSYSNLNPFGWHVSSVILHIIAVFFCYKVINSSLKTILPNDENSTTISLITLIASTCFAIHPAQTESVAWVSAFTNPLNSTFIFISLFAYLKLKESYRWLILSCLSYILALLTKEAAIILPAILVCYEFFLIPQTSNLFSKLRLALVKLSAFGLITLGYFYLRIAILGSIKSKSAHVDFPGIENISLFNTLITLPSILLNYLQILVWPFSNNPMYETRFISELNLVNFYLPLLLLLGLLFLSIICAFKYKVIQLALIWLVIPLIPVMDVRSFKPEDLVHDRYLYLSTIGLGIILALIVKELNHLLTNNKTISLNFLSLHPLLTALLTLLIILTSIITIKQNNVWSNEWQLWSTAYENVPNSCIVNLELGRLSEENKQDDKMALVYYQKAKTVCPDSLTLNYKLGLLYGRNNDLVNSEIAFQNMLKLTQNRFILSTAYFNLGFINEKRGNLTLAIDHYKQGLKLNPNGQNSKQVQEVIKQLNEKVKLDKPKS